MGFAKAGVNVPCVEDFRNFSRKKPFRFFFFFFVSLKKRNGFCLVQFLIELFGCKIPAFAKPFSVVHYGHSAVKV